MRSKKRVPKQMGVIVEIFSDLDPKNPWVRVLFTNPVETYQWCRAGGLEVVSTKEEMDK